MDKEKLRKKFKEQITSGEKIPTFSTFNELEQITKEDVVEFLKVMVEEEEDLRIRKKLMELLEENAWNYDKNLLLLSIWVCYSRLLY